MNLYKQTMDDIDFIIVQVPTGERNILEWKEISISDFFKAAKVTGAKSWAAIDFKIVFKNRDFIRTTHGDGVDCKLGIEYIHVSHQNRDNGFRYTFVSGVRTQSS